MCLHLVDIVQRMHWRWTINAGSGFCRHSVPALSPRSYLVLATQWSLLRGFCSYHCCLVLTENRDSQSKRTRSFSSKFSIKCLHFCGNRWFSSDERVCILNDWRNVDIEGRSWGPSKRWPREFESVKTVLQKYWRLETIHSSQSVSHTGPSVEGRNADEIVYLGQRCSGLPIIRVDWDIYFPG